MRRFLFCEEDDVFVDDHPDYGRTMMMRMVTVMRGGDDHIDDHDHGHGHSHNMTMMTMLFGSEMTMMVVVVMVCRPAHRTPEKRKLMLGASRWWCMSAIDLCRSIAWIVWDRFNAPVDRDGRKSKCLHPIQFYSVNSGGGPSLVPIE